MKRCMQNRQRFTIQKVEPTDIEIAWHDSSNSGSTSSDLTQDNIKKYELMIE